MDASDVLRRIQSETQYGYLKAQFATIQPTANISSCTVAGSNVKINYDDYAQRTTIALGKYNCQDCSTNTTLCFIVNSGR